MGRKRTEFLDKIGPKGPDDVTMYTVAVPEISPFVWGAKRLAQERMIRLIKTLEGFTAVHPVPGRATILLFREKNQAVRARNVIQGEGFPVGDHVSECFVPEADLPPEREGKENEHGQDH